MINIILVLCVLFMQQVTFHVYAYKNNVLLLPPSLTVCPLCKVRVVKSILQKSELCDPKYNWKVYLRGRTAVDIFIFIVHFGSCPVCLEGFGLKIAILVLYIFIYWLYSC